jgi:hypothetical protein
MTMNRTFRRPLSALTALAALVVLAMGCDGPVENAVDCNRVCTRYQTCFDQDYDVSQCAMDCRDSANSNENYQDDVDMCEACIDDMSCAAGTFNCAAECSTVVP